MMPGDLYAVNTVMYVYDIDDATGLLIRKPKDQVFMYVMTDTYNNTLHQSYKVDLLLFNDGMHWMVSNNFEKFSRKLAPI